MYVLCSEEEINVLEIDLIVLTNRLEMRSLVIEEKRSFDELHI